MYDRLLYADQPLGWDILGTRATIEGTTRETFLSYLDTWYRPERMVVGIGGRIGDGLAERLEELLGGIEPRPTGRRRRRAPAGHLAGPRAHEGLEQATSSSASRLPIGHPSRYALQLLAVVLGGGMSSRLFTEVRERRGLGYYVHAGNTAYTDTGTFYASAGVDVRASTRRSRHPRRAAEDRFRAGAGRRTREGTRLLEGPLRAPPREPAGHDPVWPPQEVLEGEIEEPDELLRRLDEVTVEDVQRVRSDLFEGKRLYLALVGPFDDPTRFEKLLAA